MTTAASTIDITVSSRRSALSRSVKSPALSSASPTRPARFSTSGRSRSPKRRPDQPTPIVSAPTSRPRAVIGAAIAERGPERPQPLEIGRRRATSPQHRLGHPLPEVRPRRLAGIGRDDDVGDRRLAAAQEALHLLRSRRGPRPAPRSAAGARRGGRRRGRSRRSPARPPRSPLAASGRAAASRRRSLPTAVEQLEPAGVAASAVERVGRENRERGGHRQHREADVVVEARRSSCSRSG